MVVLRWSGQVQGGFLIARGGLWVVIDLLSDGNNHL
jgi:hypothetical protein